MKSGIKYKLNHRGMTLVELLVAMLFISLLGLMTVGGIGAIRRSYYRVVTYANAQVVLSDTMAVMRDQLRYVTNITGNGTAEGTSFDNTNFGRFHYQSGSSADNAGENGNTSGPGIRILYDDADDAEDTSATVIADAMMKHRMYTKIDEAQKITADADNNTISVKIDVLSTGIGAEKDQVLASGELTVRTVNDLMVNP